MENKPNAQTERQPQSEPHENRLQSKSTATNSAKSEENKSNSAK